MRVSEIDHVNIFVEAEQGLLLELHEYFAFRPKNYQYSPLFKNRMWDGKIRLFKIANQTLYRGLIPQLQHWADQRQYKLELTGNLGLTNNISLVEAASFIKSLNLPHVPHEHQLEAFVHAARNNRATIVAATGSGKSLIAYMLCKWFNLKTLYVTTRSNLSAQTYTDFEQYGYTEDDLHLAAAGVTKQSDKQITISTWQGVYKQPKKFFQQFEMVIGDECHHYDAKSMISIMEKMSNARVRIGMTGTLEDSKAHKLVIQGLFGSVYQPASNKQLIDRGVIAMPKIKVIMLKHDDSACRTYSRARNYVKERSYVITHSKRNEFICNLALSLKGNTLIMYRFVEKQGWPLYRMMQDKFDEPELMDRANNVHFIDKDASVAKREQIREWVDSSDDAIVIASTGTFSEGANVPNLNNAILATPVKSKITVLQTIGRLLRVTPEKNTAEIFDIVDDMSVGSQINYLMRHAIIRMQLYKENGYEYKPYRVQL